MVIVQEIVCEVFTEAEPSEVLAWFQERIDSDLAIDFDISRVGKVAVSCQQEETGDLKTIDGRDRQSLDTFIIEESFPWPAIFYDQTLMWVDGYEQRSGVMVYYESPTEYVELSSIDFQPKLDVDYVARALEDEDERAELERAIALQNRFVERDMMARERTAQRQRDRAAWTVSC